MSKKASEPRIRQANGKTIRPPPTHDQAHEPYKVKKASATKAAFRVDDSLLQKFAKLIDQNQSELTDKAELELDKLEENLYQRLDNIVEEMENKFTITEEKAKRLFKLLAEEQLQITSTSASGEKKEVFLSLGDRMIEFQEIIDRHAKALDRLWREWQAIQVEIVGLYAGEFGPDAVLAVEADLSPALKGAIEAGIDSWKQTSAERQAMKDEVLALQKLIQDNASSTIKTAKEQEKIWSTAFQRKLHNIMDNLKMIS